MKLIIFENSIMVKFAFIKLVITISYKMSQLKVHTTNWRYTSLWDFDKRQQKSTCEKSKFTFFRQIDDLWRSHGKLVWYSWTARGNWRYISYTGVYLYTNKIVISLFLCPIITQEPLDRFDWNFDWVNRETHGDVLSLVLRF